jgi:hypothetical protein
MKAAVQQKERVLDSVCLCAAVYHLGAVQGIKKPACFNKCSGPWAEKAGAVLSGHMHACRRFKGLQMQRPALY